MRIKVNLLKRLNHWLSQKLERYYLQRYYDSIEELPVWNWWKTHEKIDYKYLLRNEKARVTKHAEKVFERLHDQYIDAFGLNENYKGFLNKKVEIELLEIKMALTGDKSHQIFIDILKLELEDLTSKEENKSINSSTIAIEKYMGFKLDVKKISVFDYYSYINAIEKAVKDGK